MAEVQKIRIDKWLWAVRVFKSRTLATKNCELGKVKINDETVKASYKVQEGETVVIKLQFQKKTLKVLKLIEKRVGAEIAVTCYDDISPDIDKLDVKQLKSAFLLPNAYREKGEGRPTKRDRRDIEKFNGL